MALSDLWSASLVPAVSVAVVVTLAGLVVRLLACPPARIPPAGAPPRHRVRGWAGRWHFRAAADGRWRQRWRPWEKRRTAAARRSAWPSVADELGSALRSGASLRQALGAVAAHGGAVSHRLADLVSPLDRGDDLSGAARRWAGRSADGDERLLADAVELAAGATRAEPALFDTVSRTLRERSALAGEVRAQTAQARASAAALSALPFLFTGLCALADRSILSFLVATLPGVACLIAGAVLQALGLWWMHRTIRSIAR